MVGGVAQEEGVSIGWESNNELLSRGTIVLPVVHDVILQWQWVSKSAPSRQMAQGLVMLNPHFLQVNCLMLMTEHSVAFYKNILVELE